MLFATGDGVFLTGSAAFFTHTVTGSELSGSAASRGSMSELSDPERRGEHQGAAQLGHTAGSVWAPALYTVLAVDGGTGASGSAAPSR